MQVNVTITIPAGESAADLAGNSQELAAAILTAVGGDSASDYCTVSISDAGSIGVETDLSGNPLS